MSRPYETDVTWTSGRREQALPVPAALALGGGLAFTSHSAKAATRALVNTSPGPASNVVVSTLEDGLVAALVALAFANPALAAVITLVLLGVAIAVIVMAWRLVRGFRRRRWFSRPQPGDPPPGGPAP
jgi:hypothetical protein